MPVLPKPLPPPHFLIVLSPKFLAMQTQQAIFGLGTPEVIVIVVVILIFFGGKRIPELMRGIGQGVREFNAAKSNIKQEIEDGMKDKPAAAKETTEEQKA